MSYVFDSSFVAALIIPDEKNREAIKIQKLLTETDIINTPQLLWYEMTNVFKNLLRRKRYNVEEIAIFFPLISALRLTTDFETGIDYSKEIFELCNDFNLSSYDAVYLELANRKKAILCTLDNNLNIAAKKCGVKTYMEKL
jgi:predicted nucleic acid-binding protein